MDIYEFINSKDVREHCRKIGHEFNSIEAAFLIYQSQNHTIQQKHDAWGELIEAFPDMPIAERVNCPYYESLHNMLKQYMALEERLLERFFCEEANCVYTIDRIYFIGDYYETGRLINYSISDGIKVSKELFPDRQCTGFWIAKEIIPNAREGYQMNLCTDEAGRPMRLTDVRDVMTCEELELFYSLFGLWIDVPTPFKKGDIVFENREKLGFPSEPFVLTELCTDKETEREKKIFERVKNQGDSSDMIAYGYWFFLTKTSYIMSVFTIISIWNITPKS